MPAKNSIKQYLENGYYHIYNRGVEKRKIFLDQQDYAVLLSYLKQYLLPKDELGITQILSNPSASYEEKEKARKLLHLNNFSEEIELLSHSLIPNHFHFLVHQKSAGSIDNFMNSLATRFSMFFNKKYKRVGSLYQDVYKAVLAKTDEQLIYLTYYIHKQALTTQGDALREKYPCSYSEYIGLRKTEWIKPQPILDYFSKTHPSLSYEAFMKEDNPTLTQKLKGLTLEED